MLNFEQISKNVDIINENEFVFIQQCSYEPRPDKTNKMSVRPADSDQTGLCAQWVAEDPSLLHTDSKD